MEGNSAPTAKQFRCDICNKSFSGKQNLEKHKKSVHSEKIFKCERCGETFNRQDNLKRHEKKHTQEKEFNCGNCKLKFYRKDKLKEHLNTCKRNYSGGDGKRNHETSDNEPPKKREKLDNQEACEDEPCD
ncbi:zinc finger protein OZF, partial [Exaiptasia diaphana]|uniref:C2H2-type domain-containing protein n=1 Tax=Exaiptasia diaphana TaxID=2652724 RepID=A0A913YAC0_EXADI